MNQRTQRTQRPCEARGRLLMHRLALMAGVALAGVALATVVALTAPAAASAAAQLTVTKAATSAPLLGGRATYTVTVRNTGDTKAYDLSLVDVLSSSRPNPQGRVGFVSAQDQSGTAYPTSVVTDAVTGDTTIRLLNIRDLAATETYRLTFTVDLSGDPSWRVNDLLNDTVTATAVQFPDGSGAVYAATASDSDRVLPIRIVDKTTQQSTGVEQATGTEGRIFHYSLDVQNNFVNVTNGVVITDTLPDGVEFLGVTNGRALDAGYPQRDPATGVTTLRWTVGDMGAAQLETIRYAAGIRYDYFGTAARRHEPAHRRLQRHARSRQADPRQDHVRQQRRPGGHLSGDARERHGVVAGHRGLPHARQVGHARLGRQRHGGRLHAHLCGLAVLLDPEAGAGLDHRHRHPARRSDLQRRRRAGAHLRCCPIRSTARPRSPGTVPHSPPWPRAPPPRSPFRRPWTTSGGGR